MTATRGPLRAVTAGLAAAAALAVVAAGAVRREQRDRSWEGALGSLTRADLDADLGLPPGLTPGPPAGPPPAGPPPAGPPEDHAGARGAQGAPGEGWAALELAVRADGRRVLFVLEGRGDARRP